MNAKWSMMEVPKKITRAGGTLQKVNPGTADAARKTAKKVITGVLSGIAAKHDDTMDTTGAGTAGILHEGFGTAGPSTAAGAGIAGTGLGSTAVTPIIHRNNAAGAGTAGTGSGIQGEFPARNRNSSTGAGTDGTGIAGTSRGTGTGAAGPGADIPAVYRNFHDDDDGEAQKRRATTARYESIRTQRQIRGEHEAIGSGPTADCFECGDFFPKDDLRTQMSVLVEDSRKLLISSSSFARDDWTCISCDKAHHLLPLKTEKNNWREGRKLIFLCDQNFPAVLPSRDESCPVVFRVEGGLLREIGIAFMNMLGDFTIPEGSVIVIGSLSHLMEEGRVGYSKGLVTEYIRFTKAFKNTVHVVPFLTPPLCGTNDPELLRVMLDITVWIEKLQKFKISEYYSELRVYITAYSGCLEQTIQNTQRHKMPKAFEAYNDKNYMCHEWAGLGSSLQTMDMENERSLIGLVMSGLSSAFRWNLDDNPNLSRNPTARPANSAGLLPSSPTAPLGVLIGGSNTSRLTRAFEEMEKPVESLEIRT